MTYEICQFAVTHIERRGKGCLLWALIINELLSKESSREFSQVPDPVIERLMMDDTNWLLPRVFIACSDSTHKSKILFQSGMTLFLVL